MRDLAPNIVRQRLLVEGFFTIDVDEDVIRSFFERITAALGISNVRHAHRVRPGW